MREAILCGKPWPPHKRSYVLGSGIKLELGKRTQLMGILNVTPDSFSDGGQYMNPAEAVARAEGMVAAGADLLDIGGESTRPGASAVSLPEELDRVLPVLDLLRSRVPIPISIDTYKAAVADQALQHGAHVMNDIWGFRKDPEMAAVAARHGCPVVLMHNREKPNYAHFMDDVKHDLEQSISIGIKAGVAEDKIWLDPGIGFAKTYEQNLLLMRSLHEIVELGFPVLLGTSRKSMIWRTLDTTPDQVLEGTAATVTMGIAQGCQVMRVHDIAEIRKVIRMTDAMMGKEREDG